MPSKKVVFIRELRRTGEVAKAVIAVDWSRPNAYYHRYQDTLFKEAWDKAISEYDEEFRRKERAALRHLVESH